MANDRPLEPRQKQFVVEYLKDFNATQAVIRAGYSKKGASAAAARMLANVRVQAAVQLRAARLVERQDFTADQVLQEAAKIAFSDIRQLFKPDGTLREPHELDEATAKAVSSYKRDKDGRIELRLVAKDKGLELLAKYYGLLREKVEVSFNQQALETLPPEELAAVKAQALDAQHTLAKLGGG